MGSSIFKMATCIRVLAEVSFLCGEAFVKYVQSEGVQLNEPPSTTAFTNTTNHPHLNPRTLLDPVDGREASEVFARWIKALKDRATAAFMRGIEIGVELQRPWMMSSDSVYLWNYNRYILEKSRFPEMVATFQVVQ